MTDLILALDQGTTSSRSILFTEKAEIRAVASEPLECRYPDSGWVEQDAEAIWETQRSTIVKVLDQRVSAFPKFPPLESPTSGNPPSPGTVKPEKCFAPRSTGNADVLLGFVMS